MSVITGASASPANLIPWLLNKFSNAFRHQTNLANLVNVDSRTLTGTAGETIKVGRAESLELRDVAPSVLQGSVQLPTFYEVSISLNKWKHVKIANDDRLVAMVGGSNAIIPPIISEASDAIAKGINDAILDEFRTTANVVATTSEPLGSLNSFVACNRFLSLNAPEQDRFAVISRDAEAALLLDQQFTTVDYHATNAPIVHGSLGRRLGYDIVPTNIDRTASISDVGGPISVVFTPPGGDNLVKPNRDYTVTVTASGASPTSQVRKGNILVIDPAYNAAINMENSILVAMEDGPLISAASTFPLKVRSSENFFLASNPLTAPVTADYFMLNVTDEGFIFQKSSTTVISRPSAPLGFSASSGSIFDANNNMSYGMEYYRGNKMDVFDLDVLFGVGMINPQFMVRNVKYDQASPYV